MQLLLRMRSSKELTKEQTKTMRILPRLRIFLFALNGAAMLMSNQASGDCCGGIATGGAGGGEDS
ncbi:MAG: hypothetical protein DMG49_11040 [Acidobacteria bacterium]|nr:MAG: hypothetical protein DMG49_11040 [Acidobacteriota bacterium]